MFDRRLGRTFTPPRPIYVDMDQVLPNENAPWPRLPAVVAKLGLRLRGSMAGEQKAWHRLADGRWVAAVHVPVDCGDRGWIFLDFVVPAALITPREDAAAFPPRPTNHWGQSE